MLHVICTRLRLGHLSVCVGDASQCSEEIVKNLACAPLNAIIISIIICVGEWIGGRFVDRWDDLWLDEDQ